MTFLELASILHEETDNRSVCVCVCVFGIAISRAQLQCVRGSRLHN
jgi:hypothetical protein